MGCDVMDGEEVVVGEDRKVGEGEKSELGIGERDLLGGEGGLKGDDIYGVGE